MADDVNSSTYGDRATQGVDAAASPPDGRKAGGVRASRFNGDDEQFSRDGRYGQDAGKVSSDQAASPRGGPKVSHNETTLKFGERSNQSFASPEAAAAYARNLRDNKSGAAVVAENGQYSVYKLQEPASGWFTSSPAFDINGVAPQSPLTRNAQVAGAGVKALITGDGYVVDLGGPGSRVELSGSADGPFSGHVKAFGNGLEALRDDKDRFEKQFELAMRDAAFTALDAGETEAKAAASRLRGDKFTPGDSAAIRRTQDRLAPVDKRIIEKRGELAKAEGQAAVANAALTRHESVYHSEDLIKTLVDSRAKADRLKAELAQLQGERAQAAREFPLLLRVDPEKMREFDDRPETGQTVGRERVEGKVEFLRKEAGGVLADVRTTRDNLKSGRFNLWTMDGVRNTAAAGLGVTGDHLTWVEDRARHEGRVEAAWKIGEGALAVGLAVGSAFVSGGTSLALLGASNALSLHGAVNSTLDYFKTSAAVNTGLDPNAGMIPQDLKGEWGWVAAEWIGAGMDFAAVVKAARTLQADISKLGEVAKAMGTTPEEVKVSLAVGKVSSVTTETLPPAEFAAKVQNNSSQAATLVHKGENGPDSLEILIRSDLSVAERRAALAEEAVHVEQFGDPVMRGKMLELNEKQLARWPQMEPAEKLALYKTQLEVEADAQRRILARTPPGADEMAAWEHLDNIEYKLREIRDSERALGGKSDWADPGEKPVWLDEAEPPRLSNKKGRTAKEESAPAPQSAKELEAIKALDPKHKAFTTVALELEKLKQLPESETKRELFTLIDSAAGFHADQLKGVDLWIQKTAADMTTKPGALTERMKELEGAIKRVKEVAANGPENRVVNLEKADKNSSKLVPRLKERSPSEQMAGEKGYPAAPTGYHWTHKDDALFVQRNAENNGHGLFYDRDMGGFVKTKGDLIRAEYVKNAAGKVIVNEYGFSKEFIDETITPKLEAREKARIEYNALEKLRLELREKGEELSPKQATDRAAAKTEMDKQSRLLGEHGAKEYIEKNYPGAELIYGGPDKASASGDFDQVWKVRGPDGKDQYIVVEAKGGSAELGSRLVDKGMQAQQGTDAYYKKIVALMGKSGDQKALDAVEALSDKSNTVKYIKVQTPVKDVEADKAIIKEFDRKASAAAAAKTAETSDKAAPMQSVTVAAAGLGGISPLFANSQRSQENPASTALQQVAPDQTPATGQQPPADRGAQSPQGSVSPSPFFRFLTPDASAATQSPPLSDGVTLNNSGQGVPVDQGKTNEISGSSAKSPDRPEPPTPVTGIDVSRWLAIPSQSSSAQPQPSNDRGAQSPQGSAAELSFFRFLALDASPAPGNASGQTVQGGAPVADGKNGPTPETKNDKILTAGWGNFSDKELKAAELELKTGVEEAKKNDAADQAQDQSQGNPIKKNNAPRR